VKYYSNLLMADNFRRSRVIHSWAKHSSVWQPKGIMARDFLSPDLREACNQTAFALLTAHCFEISNVSSGMEETSLVVPTGAVIDPFSFPCVYPPYKEMWVEYQLPHRAPGNKVGFIIMAVAKVSRDPKVVQSFVVFSFFQFVEMAKKVGPWHGHEPEQDFVIKGPGGGWFLHFGDKNKLISVETVSHIGPPLPLGHSDSPRYLLDEQKEWKFIGHNKSRWLQPVYYALALLHCKNVRRVERQVQPAETTDVVSTRKVQKVPPSIRYKILDIQPMSGEVVRSASSKKAGSWDMPFKFCRGHVKNYDERPLFGKHRGSFWWSDHARGDKKNGQIIKDYRVSPPSQ
jgi:hypothetical protein